MAGSRPWRSPGPGPGGVQVRQPWFEAGCSFWIAGLAPLTSELKLLALTAVGGSVGGQRLS